MIKVLTITALLVCSFLFAKASVRAQQLCGRSLSKDDMEFLLKDAPPQALKELQDPETKKRQIKSLRQTLALACAAEKEGFTNDSKTIAELEDIRIQIIATNYDREIGKNKPPTPPFDRIGEDRIKEFWNATREAEFQKFFDLKISLGKESGQIANDREPTEKDIKEAREYFAKTRIYVEEAKAKWDELPDDLRHRIELSVMLQHAQYLSRLYAEKVLVDKTGVSDEEIEEYIAGHPELNSSDQRAKAEKILQRARSGEDFAKLAAEFSEDPGSKDRGGLYENVSEGQFVQEFEQAALALVPGEMAPNIVETKYGFHIIKLEKRGEIVDKNGEKKQVYDVRHILIMTTFKDPNDPSAKPVSPREFVKSKLEEEKETAVLEKVLAENPVEVAEDFEVPKPPAEDSVKTIAETPQEVVKVKTVALPAKIKSYLNKNYKGWKLSPSEYGCGAETNNGVVKGNFNADKKQDYAVKITLRKKGYIIAFLAQGQDYKAFVLHDTDAEEVTGSSLGTLKKGEEFPYDGVNDVDGKTFRLKYDAPQDYHCESDVGGIHYYRNGKFIAY